MRNALVGLMLGSAIAGCGSGDPSYSVAGHRLTVRDLGYYYSPNRAYCDAGPLGQVKVVMVDYGGICDPQNPNARNTAVEHWQLEVDIGYGVNHQPHDRDPKKPYTVTVPNCVLGPGAEAWAYFVHYAAGSTTPDMQTPADSGSVLLDQFAEDRSMPAKGSFDLHFGADEVKGSFEAFACN